MGGGLKYASLLLWFFLLSPGFGPFLSDEVAKETDSVSLVFHVAFSESRTKSWYSFRKMRERFFLSKCIYVLPSQTSRISPAVRSEFLYAADISKALHRGETRKSFELGKNI